MWEFADSWNKINWVLVLNKLCKTSCKDYSGFRLHSVPITICPCSQTIKKCWNLSTRTDTCQILCYNFQNNMAINTNNKIKSCRFCLSVHKAIHGNKMAVCNKSIDLNLFLILVDCNSINCIDILKSQSSDMNDIVQQKTGNLCKDCMFNQCNARRKTSFTRFTQHTSHFC